MGGVCIDTHKKKGGGVMSNRWRGLAVFVAAVALGIASVSLPSSADAAEKKTDKAVLDEVLDILRERGQITEEKYRELKDRAKQEGAGKLLAGFEGWTPYIKSADGDHKIEFHGRVHFDMRAYEEDARNLDSNRSNLGANRNDLVTNFRVRRARLGVDATFFKHLDFKVEGDFGEVGSTFILTDGYLELKYWPEARLRGGQFKVPFSFEELTSSRFIDFVERSVVNNLVPARDVGAMVHGRLFGGLLEYAGGVFNGAGQNTAETNDSKDYAGRLLVRPFRLMNIPALEKLHVAGHITHGDQDSGLSLQGRTDARFVFFPRVATRGDRLRYGFEAVYAYGPFGLYGEYVNTEQERKACAVQNAAGTACTGGADLPDVEAWGWYVAGTVFVTGEEKVHGRAPRVKPMNPRAGDFGALELVARYAQLDFDASPLPQANFAGTAANRVDALTVGFNWYLSPNVRLMVNWVQSWFDNEDMTPMRGEDTSWEILSRLAIWF
jgi:phosphate-selective porin OprO/OprP